jgi:hemoglobin
MKLVPPPIDGVGLRDLEDRAAVAEMVVRFYRLVAMDDLLGPMFNDVAKVDWSEHLPKLTDFWCRMLFAIPGYEGNPYRAHQRVHALRPFTAAHFERWLDLFHETIDAGWAGPNVERAKAFAAKVARVHSQQLVGTAVELDVCPAHARSGAP